MSIWGVRVSWKLAAIAVISVIAGAVIPLAMRPPAREITLVVRGMTFFLENDLHTPNPTIEVKAGEHVRIVLRNDDRGFTHDFAVPTLNVAVDAINWNESDDVVIDVPKMPGTYEYVCQPHALMMRGTLRVTQVGDSTP
jgi:plastocyanin